MAISVPNSQLLGYWFVLILTGVYLSFIPQLVSILRRKWRDGSLLLWLPIASFLFFLVFFVHLGIDSYRVWLAFGVRGMEPGDPIAFYESTTSPGSVAKNGLTVALAILSDIILVYRTYIVWSSQWWVIVVPSGLLLAGLSVGGWATWTLTQSTGGDPLIAAAVTERAMIFFSITFTLNLLCSGLIIFNLWRISSQVTGAQNLPGTSTGRVLGIIIESAAIYCAHLCAIIVSSSIGSNMFFAFLDPLPQVTVIAFSLLIMRVARNARRDTQSTTCYTGRSWTAPRDMSVEIDLERLGRRTTVDTRASMRTVPPPYGVHVHTEQMTDAGGGDLDKGVAL